MLLLPAACGVPRRLHVHADSNQPPPPGGKLHSIALACTVELRGSLPDESGRNLFGSYAASYVYQCLQAPWPWMQAVTHNLQTFSSCRSCSMVGFAAIPKSIP
eukprot:1925119-Amphidinium_carterae.1